MFEMMARQDLSCDGCLQECEGGKTDFSMEASNQGGLVCKEKKFFLRAWAMTHLLPTDQVDWGMWAGREENINKHTQKTQKSVIKKHVSKAFPCGKKSL